MLFGETVIRRLIRWFWNSPFWQIMPFFSVEGKTLYATHGHIFNQDNLPPMQEGDILIHGHTHLLKAEETEGDCAGSGC